MGSDEAVKDPGQARRDTSAGSPRRPEACCGKEALEAALRGLCPSDPSMEGLFAHLERRD
ncbi:MAG: hypothetical protein AAFX00_09610 [Pseudomonadota bacterium]